MSNQNQDYVHNTFIEFDPMTGKTIHQEHDLRPYAKIVNKDCPQCHSTERVAITKDGGSIVKCTKCHTRYVNFERIKYENTSGLLGPKWLHY